MVASDFDRWKVHVSDVDADNILPIATTRITTHRDDDASSMSKLRMLKCYKNPGYLFIFRI